MNLLSRGVVALWACLSVFSALSASNSQQLVPIEVYGELPSKTNVVISPSANRLAFRDTSKGQDNLLVIDLKAGKPIAKLDVSKQRVDHLYFVNDDKIIIRSSNHQGFVDFYGDYDVSSASLFNIKNNTIDQMLTPGRVIDAQLGMGTVIGISDDEKWAYMPALLINKADPDLPPYGVVKVNLDDPKRAPRIVTRGTRDTKSYFLTQDKEPLARVRYNSESHVHSLQVHEDGSWRTIYKETKGLPNKTFVAIMPDYKGLLFSQTEGDSDYRSYYRMELADGAISGPIFAREDASVARVITDINKVVQGARYRGFQPSYEFLDPKIDGLFKSIAEAMPNDSIRLVDYTPNWSHLIFRFEGDGMPGDYGMYHDGSFQYLATSRPNLDPAQMAPVEITSYQARDGLTIPTLLTRPVGVSKSKPLPTVVLPHGGPASYDSKGFDWLAQYFASRGMLVIQPQYRGSIGFGYDHYEKGDGQWGKRMQDDLIDAVNVLVKSGHVDKDNVCIVGASYGGYAALAGVSFSPETFKCAISINGVTDLEELYYKKKRRNDGNSISLRYFSETVVGGDKKVTDDYLQSISPVNFAEQITAPVLLIHGENDEVVEARQSKAMHRSLQWHKKDSELIILEGEDHYLSSSKTRLQALQAIEAFIQKHMM